MATSTELAILGMLGALLTGILMTLRLVLLELRNPGAIRPRPQTAATAEAAPPPSPAPEGPALAITLNDETEATLEETDRDTIGAVSDYRVCAAWYEQDERDADDECSRESTTSSRD